MPHKRRKKKCSAQSVRGGPIPLSDRPTRALLLTYYKQLDSLTQLITSSTTDSSLPRDVSSFADTILVADLSSDPTNLVVDRPDGTHPSSMTEVSRNYELGSERSIGS